MCKFVLSHFVLLCRNPVVANDLGRRCPNAAMPAQPRPCRNTDVVSEVMSSLSQLVVWMVLVRSAYVTCHVLHLVRCSVYVAKHEEKKHNRKKSLVHDPPFLGTPAFSDVSSRVCHPAEAAERPRVSLQVADIPRHGRLYGITALYGIILLCNTPYCTN